MNLNLLAVLLFVVVMSFFVILYVMRKDMANFGVLLKQITSGRWLLTVTAGLCLMIAMLADAWIAIKGVGVTPRAELPFPVSTIFTLLGVVFTSYFNKKDVDPIKGIEDTEEK
jgi:preprotein translocase subunit YajC